MPLFNQTKQFRRTLSNGTVRIVRDTYSNKNGNWKQQSRDIKALDERCCDCGRTARETPQGHLELHHIKTLNSGGTTQRHRMATLCVSCHNKRHSHLHKGRS